MNYTFDYKSKTVERRATYINTHSEVTEYLSDVTSQKRRASWDTVRERGPPDG